MTSIIPVNDFIVIAPSAARTVTYSPGEQPANYKHRGVLLVVDLTAVAATETITPAIDFYDDISGKWINLITGTAIGSNGTASYLVYPGVGTAAAGITKVAGFCLPRRWRVTITHSASGAHTYSVGAHLLL